MVNRLEVARHEVGHALVAAGLGVHVDVIRLGSPDPGVDGSVLFRLGDHLDAVAVGYGGALALVGPADADRAVRTDRRFSYDRDLMHEVLSRARQPDPAHYRTGLARARRTLAPLMPLLDPFAEHLASAGELDPRWLARAVATYRARTGQSRQIAA